MFKRENKYKKAAFTINLNGVVGQKGVIIMLSWKLKSCSRCGGDLFIERDTDGWFVQCLQCSHRRELIEYKKRLIPVGVKPHPVEDWSKR